MRSIKIRHFDPQNATLNVFTNPLIRAIFVSLYHIRNNVEPYLPVVTVLVYYVILAVIAYKKASKKRPKP